MRKEIEKLIFEYEQGLGDRIEQRKMMCQELGKIT